MEPEDEAIHRVARHDHDRPLRSVQTLGVVETDQIEAPTIVGPRDMLTAHRGRVLQRAPLPLAGGVGGGSDRVINARSRTIASTVRTPYQKRSLPLMSAVGMPHASISAAS